MSDLAPSPVQTPIEVEESGPSTAPTAPQPKPERARRKLDLSQNKRGAFSVLMGTLNKAKKEDKERNASEAAQKRALLEKRLHAKLARQSKSADRATQSKRERAAAAKKEEELAMKENLMRFRQRQIPNLAQCLLTSDRIDTDTQSLTSQEVLAAFQPPRSHGPPGKAAKSVIFYKPAKLLPWQEELISRRTSLVKAALEQEWNDWKVEKEEGLEKVEKMKKSAEELLQEPKDDDEEMKDTDKGEAEAAGVDESPIKD
ncbi:hypothetical protein FRC17_010239 [Serendipita sp. 399]|nr:hypothetical protein FRC17_010239 [Serendipita sp. 399]